MSNIHFNHVAILVRNLEESVQNYKKILNVLDHESSKGLAQLEKRGEHVHHIEFCSDDVKSTFQKLQSAYEND